MGTLASPWYWKARDGWYVQIDRRHILLAKGKTNRAAANKALQAILGENGKVKAGKHLEDIANLFLADAQKTLRPLTFEFYLRHLGSFLKHPKLPKSIEDIRAHHVAAWLDSHADWGLSNRRGAITSVKRLFRWAWIQGHVDVNHLQRMTRPKIQRRELILSPEQAETVMNAITDEPFADYLLALRLTGARPSEVNEVQVEHVDFATKIIVMESKTTTTTGRKRVIPLCDEALRLFQRRCEGRSVGYVFQNTSGHPWTRNSTACRFRRLRLRLGLGPELTADSFRHLFATEALARGIPEKWVWAIMGHTESSRTGRQHYDHLMTWTAEMVEQVNRIGTNRPE
jgi:integrase